MVKFPDLEYPGSQLLHRSILTGSSTRQIKLPLRVNCSACVALSSFLSTNILACPALFKRIQAIRLNIDLAAEPTMPAGSENN